MSTSEEFECLKQVIDKQEQDMKEKEKKHNIEIFLEKEKSKEMQQ